jgi:tetratricopeptide (TPR) repeat protein
MKTTKVLIGSMVCVLLGFSLMATRAAEPVTAADKQKQVEALTEKMMLAGMAGKNKEALEACDQLIALNPGFGDQYCARGNWLRGLGRKDEAMAAFEKAATLTTNMIVRVDCWRSQGELLVEQKKYEEAIKLYTKAIDMMPAKMTPADGAGPWFRRAEARALAGDNANALTDLKQAIERRPGDIKKWAKKSAAFKSLKEKAEFKDLIK